MNRSGNTGQRTLLAAMLLSLPGPLVLGAGLLLGRSSTQLADFIRRTAELGAQISERTGQEIRVTVPGHMQRGGEPCPYDRVIATRLGAEAAEMIRRKEYGYMVALNNNKIEKIPLADIAGKLKMVDPKSDIIREAKDVGISFGDE